MTGQLYTMRQVAEILAVSYRTVQRKVRSGELGHHRVGRQVRISDEHLTAFLAAADVGPEPSPRADVVPIGRIHRQRPRRTPAAR